MRNILFILLILFWESVSTAQNYTENPDVLTACRGYIEVDGSATDYSLNTSQLTSWPNDNGTCVQYIHFPSGYVKGFLSGRGGGLFSTFKLALTITDVTTGRVIHTGDVSLSYGIRESETQVFNGVYFPSEGWYKFELKRNSGTLGSISNWKFYKESSLPVYLANNFSSPSVHIWYGSNEPDAPKSAVCDWLYHEVMIPQEADYKYTYAMSIGLMRLYMGIQVNGPDRHDVIFSVWDNGDTDVDPNLAEHLKSGTLDSGEGVTIERFGNEGTGSKAFKQGDYWVPGEFVQFICNARPAKQKITKEDGETVEYNSMLITAWYKRESEQEWHYLATHCCSGSESLFDTAELYSFLENYVDVNGQVLRKAYYRNAFVHSSKNNKWYHLNQVGYSNTDGGTEIGARCDYGHGVASEYDRCFFMTTGGYIPTVTGPTTITLYENNNIVDAINLQMLEKRVNQAVRTQSELSSPATLEGYPCIDNKLLKVIDWSDEETTGEGDYGRAVQVLDGSEESYWHSQWESSTYHYPHYITIEAPCVYKIGALELCTKRYNYSNTTYNPSKISIEVSQDGNLWEKVVYSEYMAISEYPTLIFNEPISGKYFRIIFEEGHADFLYINELYLYGEEGALPDDNGLVTVKNMNELSNNKAYVITNSNGMGSIIYNSSYSNTNIWLADSRHANIYSPSYSVKIDDYDAAQNNWYIINVNNDTFLCNAKNKKFVKTGWPCGFVSQPTKINIEEHNGTFTFNSSDDSYEYMCASPQLDAPVNVWSSDDNGSSWMIRENPDFIVDNQSIIDLISGKTGVEEICNEIDGEDVIYDLTGRRVDKPSKGIYIINGKKVLIK